MKRRRTLARLLRRIQRWRRGNDVADADVRRADARGSEYRHAPVPTPGRRPDLRSAPAPSELSHADEEVPVRGEETKRAEKEDARAERHVIEEVLGGFRPALTRLVDLRSGDRLGVGKLLVLDHHPPHERDEEDSGNDQHHERRRLPVGVAGRKRGPGARDDEAGW
jgi:hypothetical protein